MGFDALVVVGGDGDDPVPVPDMYEDGVSVIAADSGLHLAQSLGLRVDHVVGDLDSVDADLLGVAIGAGAVVHRHPADKDATDSELAIELALDLAPGPAAGPAGGGPASCLTVLGRGEGRLDHLVADLLMLGSPRLERFQVTARFGPATISVVRPEDPRHLTGTVGEQVSLIPVSGMVHGITTSGLRWPLEDAELLQGSTRGVSNELVGGPALVRISGGTMLVVQPGTTAPPIAARGTTYDPSPRPRRGRSSPFDPADGPARPER